MAPIPAVPSFPRPQDWAVGMRVVVRYLIPGGATDALGYIVNIDDDHAVIDTRRGQVTVAWDEAVAGKLVPPPPTRRKPKQG